MLFRLTRLLLSLVMLAGLSGCVSMAVGAAVGVTGAVVGGAIDVADAVTPDIIDDDDD